MRRPPTHAALSTARQRRRDSLYGRPVRTIEGATTTDTATDDDNSHAGMAEVAPAVPCTLVDIHEQGRPRDEASLRTPMGNNGKSNPNTDSGVIVGAAAEDSHVEVLPLGLAPNGTDVAWDQSNGANTGHDDLYQAQVPGSTASAVAHLRAPSTGPPVATPTKEQPVGVPATPTRTPSRSSLKKTRSLVCDSYMDPARCVTRAKRCMCVVSAQK